MPLGWGGAGDLQVGIQGAEQVRGQKNDQAKATNDALAQSETAPNEIASKVAEKQLNMVTITPELAKGLVDSTGDKSWEQAMGTKMDGKIYSSLLTMGVRKNYRNNIIGTPSGTFQYNTDTQQFDKIGDAKPTKMTGYLHGKKFSGTISYDDSGQPMFKPLDEGITPADEHPNKGKGAGKEDPQDKEFLKTYRKAMSDTQGVNGMTLEAMGKSNPARASELRDKMTFLQKHKARFDSLNGTSDGGGAGGGGADKPSTYKSAQEVGEAVKSGTLPRDQAEKILHDQFGMQ